MGNLYDIAGNHEMTKRDWIIWAVCAVVFNAALLYACYYFGYESPPDYAYNPGIY